MNIRRLSERTAAVFELLRLPSPGILNCLNRSYPGVFYGYAGIAMTQLSDEEYQKISALCGRNRVETTVKKYPAEEGFSEEERISKIAKIVQLLFAGKNNKEI